MDYCTSCRRDLNGALVCPGCGAYAPDIAPPSHRHHAAGTSTVTARLATDGQDVRDRGSYPSGAAYFDAPLNSSPPDTAPPHSAGRLDGPGVPTGDDAGAADADDGITGGAATGQGRAARRRQLARWKKHRRRAAAATAVALVGGGLTVAALPSGKPAANHAQASAPPEPSAAVTPSGSASPGGASAGAPATEAAQRPGIDRPPTTRAHRRAAAESAAPRDDARERTGTGTAGQSRNATSSESDASRSSGDRPAAPPSAPQVPEQASGGSTPATPAPETSSPPPAVESPGPATPPAGLLPATPGGSPVQVCLVGLCIG
ncbi:hypothetical protein [Streptomyces wuyuanensis]|uniref:SCO2400 family protein n=1 Tax=Streptomyces wuyuanensis TaxID=1196353 RepID=UPI003798B9E0